MAHIIERAACQLKRLSILEHILNQQIVEVAALYYLANAQLCH